MNFAKPQLLWLLLLTLPIAGLVWWSWRMKQKTIAQFVSARLLDTLLSGVSKSRQKLRAALFVAALTLLLFSLARPRWGFDIEEARQRGLDVVVAIDTSKSMLADDVQPNRLRRAKLAALDLMRTARSDRLGLVAFAGSAFLQCPLSLDDEAFRQSVETLDVNIIPQGGTALGEAIQTALAAFKEKTENHKVLVLFTDGEDHDSEGSAATAARDAAKEGLRVFTVGVGTPNGELLSTTDPYGNRVFIKDAEGNVVKSRLNEPLLQQIAKETGGFYLPLTGARTMEILYERGLAPLPKSEFAARTIRQYHERFQWFIGLAVLLLLGEMFFPERVKGTSTSRKPKAAAAVVAVIVWLAVPTAAFGSVSDALQNYARGKFDRARTEFERLARKKPEDVRLRFNAGAAAFKDEDYETALKHFSASLSAPDLALQERSYYNLGNTQFRLGENAKDPKEKMQQWEQAVQSYENALKLDPKDEDAKFNAELVKKKIDELKQQQQQQNKDQKNDDKKDEQKQDKDKQDKQDKDKEKQKDEKKEQEKKDQQQQKPEEKQDEKSEQEQKQPQEQKPDDQKSQDQQQQKAQDQRGEKPDPQQAMNAGKVIQMTPQQAAQLLEAQKAEEKTMIFQPLNLRTNRNNNRVFKDW